ncbi:MAG: hypothetical protein NTV32_00630 [Gammaproteobacteria bacterium]|nr:hypothetical protein [Gammaproteobacteria bacterium]
MGKKQILVLLSLCLLSSPISDALGTPVRGQHQALKAYYNNPIAGAVADHVAISPENINQVQAQIQEIQSSLQMNLAEKGVQQKADLTEGLSIGFGAFMIVASIGCYMTGVGVPIGVNPYMPNDINQAISQLAQSMGQMQSQIDQGAATKAQANAEIMQATEQSLNQGIQQIESLGEQFRSSMESIAQDMMSMVSATRV